MKDGGLKMDSRKRAIVIGALLHDIGKVGQRIGIQLLLDKIENEILRYH